MKSEKRMKESKGSTIRRPGRKKAAFIHDKRYQEDPEFADAIPASRWHNVELEWHGVRHRFGMNINDYYAVGPSPGDIRLGHVYVVDEGLDQWVEVHRNILQEAREDKRLMESLIARVIQHEGRSDLEFGITGVSGHEEG